MSVKKYDSTTKLLKLIAGGTLWADCPLGTINAFGGTTAPEGWLLCQGQAISRTEYADLFAVIGTNFGSGDGSTTFNLPDLRGEFLRGAGTNSHSDQGNGGAVGEHQNATVHMHNYNIANSTTNWMTPNTNDRNIDASVFNTMYSNISAGSEVQSATVNGARYTARPTNTSVNYIMKTKQAPIPADLKAFLESALDDKDMLVWG